MSRMPAPPSAASLLMLLAMLGAAPALAAGPQEPPADDTERPAGRFAETLRVRAVDVVVEVRDADGEVPSDLTAADFEVVVDGEPRPVVAVLPADGAPAAATPAAPGDGTAAAPGGTAGGAGGAPAASEWTSVIYFEQPLLSVPALGRAARALAGEAAALTALGPVEVVLADPIPRTVLAGTRDADALRGALDMVAGAQGGQALLVLRRRFQQEVHDDQMRDVLSKSSEAPRPAGPQRGQPGGGGSGRPGQTIIDRSEGRADNPLLDVGRQLTRQRMLVRQYAQMEADVLTRQRTVLLDWLAGYGGGKPRALMLVSDGFDEDPRDFYLNAITSRRGAGELAAELASLDSGPGSEELAQVIAGHGWTVLPVAVGGLSTAAASDASSSGRERYRGFVDGKLSRAGGRGYQGGSALHGLFDAPLAPLVDLADATGGELVVDERRLPAAVADLGRRVIVTYQAAEPGGGAIQRLEVRSTRPGLEVTTPRYVAAATPEAVAALRARRLIEGAERHGTLPLGLEVEAAGAGAAAGGPVSLRATTGLGPLAAVKDGLTDTSLRVTVGVLLPTGQMFVHHETANEQDLSHLASWLYNARLDLPAGSSAAAIVVEELSTGAWGGAAAPLQGAATSAVTP